MNRDTRPPSRVSKACDRCRTQKKRCDFVRPCQYCINARTECTSSPPSITKKSRIRRNAEGRLSTTSSFQEASSHPLESELQAELSNRLYVPGRDDSQEVDQPDKLWGAGRISNASDNQTSPQRQAQREQDGSSLPEFDADSALAMTRKIFRSQQSPRFKDRATFAIPGGGRRDTSGTNSSNQVPTPLVPIVDIIGIDIPTHDVCNKLMETYFSTVHWFSLVIYEPKFRSRYNAILGSRLASRSDHGFLLLLLMVLIMGCWYTPKHKTGDAGLSRSDMDTLRSRLLRVVQRDFMEIMDEDSLEFVQLCALLGSFYLYHGRPRSSFSILGAATKTSQAMDLHRDSEMRWSFEDREERKRVWWTIYTWDRFATITYGRPLGINDKDCNVQMPSEILENVHFDPRSDVTPICLSTYQCKLNQVYKIASPLLEDIYGIRTSHNTDLSSQLPEMVATANQALLAWYQDLPLHLSFDHLNDLTACSSTEEKAHSLQALSLQLTYDNLMIVLHRPLLAGREQEERTSGLQTMSPNSQFADSIRDVGFRRCLSSALRISNIQRKQNLFSLAGTTHLVSFLGMNLFTASVVLFICALSDTLSDTAQEAKRGLKRMLQMQKALSNYASLSLQCSTILEDLVQLILKREMEAMLVDNSTSVENTSSDSTIREEKAGWARTGGEPTRNGLGTHTGAYDAFDAPVEQLPHHENSQFQQSLMTLQRVFHDSSFPRHEGDFGARQDYGEFIPAEDNLNSAAINSQDFGYNDSISTRVEDLGQFWLWDVDNLNF